MKCNQCEAYKQIENHFECKANIPDEMVKTFADGTCGCKYKSKTIQEPNQYGYRRRSIRST